MNNTFDFGYPWWLRYGHVVVLGPALGLLVWARRRGWPRWAVAGLVGGGAWAAASLLILILVLDVNGVPPLPTAQFLAGGTGRVLDLGAGTGRSSIMVLRARPQVTLVASDQFGESFDQHFGKGDSPQERLRANLVAAGVAERATVVTADMRQLPLATAEFDGIVSAYAVDHLGRQGIPQALREAARVLKPRGDLLLMLVENDGWARFAFGPALSHGATRGAEWWKQRLTEAEFAVVEEGRRPLTLYLLARRR
jgi:SAM-dependent methyltransferase